MILSLDSGFSDIQYNRNIDDFMTNVSAILNYNNFKALPFGSYLTIVYHGSKTYFGMYSYDSKYINMNSIYILI